MRSGPVEVKNYVGLNLLSLLVLNAESVAVFIGCEYLIIWCGHTQKKFYIVL